MTRSRTLPWAMRSARIGLIGDRDPDVVAHRAIERTLALAADEPTGSPDADGTASADRSGIAASAGTAAATVWEWLPTAGLAAIRSADLEPFDGLWAVPATPYASEEGALRAIRFARETGRPFLGTCGGFQHALLELARHVLGLRDAGHAETDPTARDLVVVPLACSLVETTGSVLLAEGSRLRSICGADRLLEGYHCSFGVNPLFREAFEEAGTRFVATDEEGDIRAFELEGHPFFLGTLFQPERAALSGRVHPVCDAFLEAARRHASSRGRAAT